MRELLGFLHCRRMTNNAYGPSSILENEGVSCNKHKKKGRIGGLTVGEVSYFPASVEFESHDESRVESGDPPSLYFVKGDRKSKGAAITRATKFPRR